MKPKYIILTSLLFILSGCSINYSENGKNITYENDLKELELAKKSLKYISDFQTDSLKRLFSVEVRERLRDEQLNWLMDNGKIIIDNNEYPIDSIITVTYITQNSIKGETAFKEFNFPFINKNNPDSTMYFKILIANDEIYKLMLSTGMRIIN